MFSYIIYSACQAETPETLQCFEGCYAVALLQPLRNSFCLRCALFCVLVYVLFHFDVCFCFATRGGNAPPLLARFYMPAALFYWSFRVVAFALVGCTYPVWFCKGGTPKFGVGGGVEPPNVRGFQTVQRVCAVLHKVAAYPFSGLSRHSAFLFVVVCRPVWQGGGS